MNSGEDHISSDTVPHLEPSIKSLCQCVLAIPTSQCKSTFEQPIFNKYATCHIELDLNHERLVYVTINRHMLPPIRRISTFTRIGNSICLNVKLFAFLGPNPKVGGL